MIRSTKVSLKFSNTVKKDKLHLFITEYRQVLSDFVDILWDTKNIKPLLSKEITSQINSWLSARAIQCAGKQASGVVRGTLKKQEKRLWQIQKFTSNGEIEKANKLQAIYDHTKISKPKIDQVEPELDSRFVRIDLNNQTSFDGWVNLTCLGDHLKIQIPFKKTKHFNRLNTKGVLKSGIRLTHDTLTLMFDIPEMPKKIEGSVLGIDIGHTTMLSCSNGITSTKDSHGHDLSSINQRLSRKKKGSKGFKRVSDHRKNYINWAINKLNLQGIQRINLENIKYLRRGKRSSRLMSHWNYADIFSKLESTCEEQGVLVLKVNPTYTSKRCSACGWTRSNNRKGKLFKCDRCNYTDDSDLNASRNIASDLSPIYYRGKKRQQLSIREGFFWITADRSV